MLDCTWKMLNYYFVPKFNRRKVIWVDDNFFVNETNADERETQWFKNVSTGIIIFKEDY